MSQLVVPGRAERTWMGELSDDPEYREWVYLYGRWDLFVETFKDLGGHGYVPLENWRCCCNGEPRTPQPYERVGLGISPVLGLNGFLLCSECDPYMDPRAIRITDPTAVALMLELMDR